MFKRLMRAAILLLAVTACAVPEQSDQAPASATGQSDQTQTTTPEPQRDVGPVATDREGYALEEGPYGPETTIVTTFTAPADRPVYLTNCNGAFSLGLQRLVGNQWVDAWAAETNQCLSPPIVIPAGGTHRGTMTVASGADAVVDSRRTETRIEDGTYRAVWYGVLTSFNEKMYPFGEELPIDLRSSAPFEIQAAAPADPARASPGIRPAHIVSITPEHSSVAGSDTPLRVAFDGRSPIDRYDVPRLYVDRRDVTEDATISRSDDSVEIAFLRKGGWRPGRHQARVVYRDDQQKTYWYGWFFTVNP